MFYQVMIDGTIMPIEARVSSPSLVTVYSEDRRNQQAHQQEFAITTVRKIGSTGSSGATWTFDCPLLSGESQDRFVEIGLTQEKCEGLPGAPVQSTPTVIAEAQEKNAPTQGISRVVERVRAVISLPLHGKSQKTQLVVMTPSSCENAIQKKRKIVVRAVAPLKHTIGLSDQEEDCDDEDRFAGMLFEAGTSIRPALYGIGVMVRDFDGSFGSLPEEDLNNDFDEDRYVED